MTAFGFCHACRADLPTDPTEVRPTCTRCGYPATPPTWGRRTQTWVDGDWVPNIPKPEGYVWRDPALTGTLMASAAAHQERTACSECGELFDVSPRVTRKYCGDACKRRVYRKRQQGAAA